MSPLKVRRVPAFLVREGPKRKYYRVSELVTLDEGQDVRFENSPDGMVGSVSAGKVEVLDRRTGRVERTVCLNVGDRAVIREQGSRVVRVVTGAWGRGQ